MRISDLFAREARTFSFEFFPPRTPEAVEKLFRTAERLRALAPSFVSVTYGAGGSTRRNTLDLTERLQRDLGLTSMAHLTCVGHTESELRSILEELRSRGIENLMLLRGDPPAGETRFSATPGGFANGWQLVRLAREVYPAASIGCAGYPEGHPECADHETDLRYLKLKVDSGADFVVTNLFFSNDDYWRFVDRARALGVSVRIIPGIMPALSWPQIQRMAKRCGASIPPRLAADLEAAGDDAARSARIGIEHATAQCEDLLRGGAPGIHFYTLNQSPATEEIFSRLVVAGSMPEPARARR